MRFYLTERWSISRGQDTYGYNICTIQTTRNFDGTTTVDSKGQCKGGGYDMAGTSLAECLCNIPLIQDRLLAHFSRTCPNGENLPHGVHVTKHGRIFIDGGIGWSSVQDIMNSIHVRVSPNYQKRGRDMQRIGWFVEVTE